jgi:hypothetical protein
MRWHLELWKIFVLLHGTTLNNKLVSVSSLATAAQQVLNFPQQLIETSLPVVPVELMLIVFSV